MNIGIDDDGPDWLSMFTRRLDDLSKITGQLVGSRVRSPGFGRFPNPMDPHVAGVAADFPGVSERGAPAFVAAARARGLQAIDETTRAKALAHGSVNWTGPHVHVQMFPRGQTPSSLFSRPPVQLTEAP